MVLRKKLQFSGLTISTTVFYSLTSSLLYLSSENSYCSLLFCHKTPNSWFISGKAEIPIICSIYPTVSEGLGGPQTPFLKWRQHYDKLTVFHHHMATIHVYGHMGLLFEKSSIGVPRTKTFILFRCQIPTFYCHRFRLLFPLRLLEMIPTFLCPLRSTVDTTGTSHKLLEKKMKPCISIKVYIGLFFLILRVCD